MTMSTTFIGHHVTAAAKIETITSHQTWHLRSLYETCRGVFETSTRICDPDHLLNDPLSLSSEDDTVEDDERVNNIDDNNRTVSRTLLHWTPSPSPCKN